MALSRNAIYLLKQRYCQNESPKDVFKRVASALSLGDEKFEKKLYKAMTDGYFLPNSPCIRNAGMKKGMLEACFVLPIEDNITSIFETIKNTAVIFHYGGGVGINFSTLRPKGALLSSGGTSSGAISFMKIFDKVTESVKQGGFRRGAQLGVLDYNHPEIVEFARSKLKGDLQNFNISVMVTDEFMKKIENNEKIDLIFNKEIWNTIGAKDLFDLISFGAWSTGDPGLLFFDRINQDNPLYPKQKIRACNPCGESPLLDYMACCLGSINLSKFVKRNKFDLKKFSQYVELGTRALLNMNSVTWFPLPQITATMKEYNPIGLGIMGFADTLIMLGIYYDSEEALKFIDEVSKPYIEITNKIAKNSFYKRIIAPTGSLSILANCSSGIEPVFERYFQRHLTIGTITETREIYKSKYCKTAMEISPEWHLKVQAKWQEKLDGACSKTINCDYSTSVEQIRNIYISAWKMGVKGITVFREGSKEGVLRKVSRRKCDGDTCYL